MRTDVIDHRRLQALTRAAKPLRGRLAALYGRLPAGSCPRRAACCSLLPEMSLLEALAVIESVKALPADLREAAGERLVRWFLLNPVEITGCPFLDQGACIVYPARPFGCRAYGLWSPAAYRRMAEAAAAAKMAVARQWQRLGVRLQEAVTGFALPYCAAYTAGGAIDDDALAALQQAVHGLSGRLGAAHRVFAGRYFGDLGFLAAALLWEVEGALGRKLQAVRAVLTGGDRQAAEALAGEGAEIF